MMIATRKLAPLAMTLLFASALAPMHTAIAGQSGTITADAPVLEFSGSVAPGTTVGGQTGAEGFTTCPPQQLDPADTQCAHVTVKVDVPEGFWDSHIGGLRVVFNFLAGDDFELGVMAQGNEPFYEVVSASSTRPEQILVANASGTYEIHGLPYVLLDGSYWGTATLVALEAATAQDVQSPGFQAFKATPANGREGTDWDNPAAAWTGSRLAYQAYDVGHDALEPTIGIGPDGSAYIAAAGAALDGTAIQASTDGGASWMTVSPQLAGRNTPPVTFDPYVYVDGDSGRVYSIDLQALTQSTLIYSDDGGATWMPGGPQPTGVVTDHQTLFSGPVPPGSPLVTLDSAFPEILYYCFNRVAESICERSLDGGKTFSRAGYPVFTGLDQNDSSMGYGLCGGLHGHGTTDRNGTVLLPKGHCGVPSLGISDDAGITWTSVAVSNIATYVNQTSVAADSAGNYYYVFLDTSYLPYMTVSKDHGKTWSEPVMIAPPGVRDTQWPTIEAGDEGRVSVGFPCTRAEGVMAQSPTRAWDYCVVTSLDALSETPTFAANTANDPADPIHRGECPTRCGNLYDFLDLTLAPATGGGAVWAVYVDSCTDENNCSSDAAAIGFDGDRDNSSSQARGTAVKQTCGPSLWLDAGEITDDCSAAQTDQPPAATSSNGSAATIAGGSLGWTLLGWLGLFGGCRRRALRRALFFSGWFQIGTIR